MTQEHNMSLNELASRVESLPGPCRETDAAIWYAVFERPKPGDKIDRDIIGKWPRYTASIDAAMTLVPKDIWIEIKGPRKYLNIPTPVPNVWSAHIAQWNHEGDKMGWGETASLALCAAALKVRALSALGQSRSSMGGEDGPK